MPTQLRRGWCAPYACDGFATLRTARQSQPWVTSWKRCYVDDASTIVRDVVAHWDPKGLGLILGSPGNGGRLHPSYGARNATRAFLANVLPLSDWALGVSVCR